MKNKLEELKPQLVWKYFEEITKIPRPSKKEEKIRTYLLNFAKKHNLQTKTDSIGNVLIIKEATKACKQAPTIVLQSHMDMVCEKNSDKQFDFDKDAIELINDGQWIKANGTTLGADNGIGVAAQLAILSADNIEHGKIECLFTVDEETGLSGAFAIQEDFITGKILINLDSEDDGEIFIGCAGGIDTIAKLEVNFKNTNEKMFAINISVLGLKGGHSGDDINKGRANANKLLARILKELKASFDLQMANFSGGNLRNAIAREASALVVVSADKKENLIAELNILASDIANEYKNTDNGFKINYESTSLPNRILTEESQEKLINLILACQHGVLEMSSNMHGMVETSTNLASIKIVNNKAIITTSQRSEIESKKYFAAQQIASVFELAGATVEYSDGYPGWEPNTNSYIANVAATCYEKLFKVKPKVKSIHAGLECGLFLQKYPELDMVSIGPTIRDAHSPNERINIEHTEKFWLHLISVITSVAVM